MDDPMDASNSSLVTKSVIREKPKWPGSAAAKQHFSLPDSIIYYIAMNPSTPEVYNKLVQTCKYFFEKQPIIVAAKLIDGKTICSKKKCDADQKCCVKIDINKSSSKLWLTDEVYLNVGCSYDFTSLLCQKLFRCGIHYLILEGKDVTLGDF